MTEPLPTRAIDLSVEVPGTPDEVWKAIATGPGISSWFVPCQVEEREGGSVTMDFGGFGEETAVVTAWEPPRRVVFVGSSGNDDGSGPSGPAPGEQPRLAYEWLVEACAGGTCIVRLVNRGFGTGEEWDGDYDAMTQGWKLFFDNLRLHLTHFRGRHGRALTPVATAPGPNATAWEALCSALDVPPDLRPGDRLEVTADGAPPLVGTVEGADRADTVSQYRLLLESPGAGTGVVAAEGGGDQVMLSVWLYLYGQKTESEGRWAGWLAERFPAPVAADT